MTRVELAAALQHGRAAREAMEAALRADPWLACWVGRQDLLTPEQIEEAAKQNRKIHGLVPPDALTPPEPA